MPFTTNNGVRLFWDEAGSGDPLLLIMGLSWTSDMWHRTLPVIFAALSDNYLRQSGSREERHSALPYTILQMAADVAAVSTMPVSGAPTS